MKSLRQGLIDCRSLSWNDHNESSDRFSHYRTFKSSSNSEMYLLLDINRHIKCIMTRFRFGISDITVHHSRYRNVPEDALNCPLCQKCKRRWNAPFTLLCCLHCPPSTARSIHAHARFVWLYFWLNQTRIFWRTFVFICIKPLSGGVTYMSNMFMHQ